MSAFKPGFEPGSWWCASGSGLEWLSADPRGLLGAEWGRFTPDVCIQRA
jgi:hypothetical protein